jgi:hypothetical protein
MAGDIGPVTGGITAATIWTICFPGTLVPPRVISKPSGFEIIDARDFLVGQARYGFWREAMTFHRVAITTMAALGISLTMGYAAAAGPTVSAQATFENQAVIHSETGIAQAAYRMGRRYYRGRTRYWRQRPYGYYGYSTGRRNMGPPYGPRFMNCIESGHPADFCQAAGWHFNVR